MLLDKHSRKEKEFIKINKRIRALDKAHSALGYRKLDQPYQRGWWKTVRLKEFLMRQGLEDEIIDVFEKSKLRLWAKTKEKVDERWEQYHQNRKASSLGAIKGLRLMHGYQYGKLDDKIKKHYRLYLTYRTKYRVKHKYKCKISAYKYETVYERAMITHTKVMDESILQEIAELEAHLDHHYWEIQQRKYNWSWSAYFKQLNARKARRNNKQLLKSYHPELIDALAFEEIEKTGW